MLISHREIVFTNFPLHTTQSTPFAFHIAWWLQGIFLFRRCAAIRAASSILLRGNRQVGDFHFLMLQDLRKDAINRITTNRRTLEICMFLKSDRVRSGAIHCALCKSYVTKGKSSRKRGRGKRMGSLAEKYRAHEDALLVILPNLLEIPSRRYVYLHCHGEASVGVRLEM